MDWTPGTVTDLAAVCATAAGCIAGGIRGLTGEIARIVSVAAAVGVAYAVSGPMGGLAAGWFGAGSPGAGIGKVAGTVVAAVLAGGLVRVAVDKFLRILVGQPANAILGVLSGGVKMATLAGAVLWLLHMIPVEWVRDTLIGSSHVWNLVRLVVER